MRTVGRSPTGSFDKLRMYLIQGRVGCDESGCRETQASRSTKFHARAASETNGRQNTLGQRRAREARVSLRQAAEAVLAEPSQQKK